MLNPEFKIILDKDTLQQIFIHFPTFAMAFSLLVRKAIGKRDKWKCQWEDEECNKRFQDGWMVDVAHYDHDKKNPMYDDESNGRVLCVDHHQEDHERYGTGLTKKQNDWAIEQLKKRDRLVRK